MKKQKGVVLFFALIVLIIMTVIGVALAINSTQSLRMSGAGSERIEAKAIADGGLEQIISDYSGEQFANLNAVTETSVFNSNQKLKPLPDAGVRDVGCQRTANATGANLVSCRRVEISSSVTFGRDNLGSLTVVSGVEQQVLTGN
ncbi:MULTISPECIES: PilX N-terminal domain-containing pilus assembly protein [Shewanella]|uniref:pilus assembly PilX family protein n=1 Tax=Shewanella TaxID=22 RepID=UPI001BBA70F2|nr:MULTISPECIES: PilX N-terminal domain-containing pilus assembly protein [Shewanella]MCB2381875.1 pilus assembly PilX N-terminal domain-containing protein [Shewanella sp. SR1]MCL1135827.1 pilus assembly PilX N-terminal domain-containing protein [Shewanella hafniensis]GIU36223.1 pilus assembly protein PilX [Shewanella hafniensis]